MSPSTGYAVGSVREDTGGFRLWRACRALDSSAVTLRRTLLVLIVIALIPLVFYAAWWLNLFDMRVKVMGLSFPGTLPLR